VAGHSLHHDGRRRQFINGAPRSAKKCAGRSLDVGPAQPAFAALGSSCTALTLPNALARFRFIGAGHAFVCRIWPAKMTGSCRLHSNTGANSISNYFYLIDGRRNPDRLLLLGTNGDCRRNYDE
jgi:hypothetical protein